MTKTLEQMEADFAAQEASQMPTELVAAWSAKEREVAAYIAPFLKRPGNAAAIAREIVDRAQSNGRIEGDCINGEVPSSMTVSGNPLPLTV